MNIKTIITIAIALIVSLVIMFIIPNEETLTPKSVYRVYLAGKSVGLIDDKDSLDEYIDKEQQTLKDKYNADKVYAPEDLEIVKDITYNEDISTTQQIYNKIKDIEPFTIKGYEITIEGIDTTNEQGETVKAENQTIYVLDKEIFEEAMDNTIRSFVDSDSYDKYLNNEQQEIESGSTGTIIENIYIENKITIKETNIPSDETIYENVDDLSKYLLFGTLEDQQNIQFKRGIQLVMLLSIINYQTKNF